MSSHLELPILERWKTGFDAIPFTGMPSNETYAIDEDDSDAEARRKQAKRAFLAAKGVNAYPDIDYPRLDEMDVHATERQLQGLLAVTEKSDSSDGDLAYEITARKLAELYRHAEVLRRMGGLTLARTEQSRERAGTMNAEIFGEIDPKYFNGILSKDRALAQELELITPIATELLALTGPIELHESNTAPELEKTAFKTLRQDFVNLIPGIDTSLLDPSSKTMISAKDSVAYFQQTLDDTGLTDKGWTAVEGSGAAASTNTRLKQFVIGRDRASFTAKGINATRTHELIHAIRGQNMIEQDTAIKRSVLPGCDDFEEVFCVAVEQVFGAAGRVPGLQYYLSLGLQDGLDGLGKRDGGQVHEILWRREALRQIKQKGTFDEEKAKSIAYTQMNRTTRGLAKDARDIIYFKGVQNVYPWMNELSRLPTAERRETLSVALSGKFNPVDPNEYSRFAQGRVE